MGAAETFAQIERELGAGMVPRLFRLLEGQPVLLAHIWGQFRGVVLQGALPRVLKEMIGTVVATAMHCDYVRAVHLHSLTIQGVEREQLDAVARGDYAHAHLSNAMRDALRYAALAARTNASYALPPAAADDSPEGWIALRERTADALARPDFDAAERAELVLTVALFTQICVLASAFALDPNDP